MSLRRFDTFDGALLVDNEVIPLLMMWWPPFEKSFTWTKWGMPALWIPMWTGLLILLRPEVKDPRVGLITITRSKCRAT